MEYSARPPRIKGNGQTLHKLHHNWVQICMMIPGHQCGPIIGKGGSRVKAYHQETGAFVFIFNDYVSGEYLPESNEKIISLTGPPDAVGRAMLQIATIILTEPINAQVFYYDPKKGGPTYFFNQAAHDRGFGAGGYGYQGGQGQVGFQQHQQPLIPSIPGWAFELENGWGQPNPPPFDPFLQKLTEKWFNDMECHVTAKLQHVLWIRGHKDCRLEEIMTMSGCQILIKKVDKDQCYVPIIVKGECKQDVDNAVWLMNVCINAYCDPRASLVPAEATCSVQEVVMTEAY